MIFVETTQYFTVWAVMATADRATYNTYCRAPLIDQLIDQAVLVSLFTHPVSVLFIFLSLHMCVGNAIDSAAHFLLYQILN